ncbi:MAG: hypothetical protein ACK45U_06750 [bacterium]|jgi:hypothetical protein
MKKTLLLFAFVAATSMVALAHGDDKSKKGGCCSKDAKKEVASADKKDACCSKDSKKSTKEAKKTEKTEVTKD